MIVVSLALLGTVADELRGQTAALPYFVIVDGNDEPLGPVVGFESLNEPTIRFVDTSAGVPIPLTVKDDDQVAAALNTTYFSGAGCTGSPYHNPSFSFASVGLAKLTGFSYSVARAGIGGPQWLYRSSTSSAGASTTYNSTFSSSTDSCSNQTDTITLRSAAAIFDFDVAHPPPYALQ